MVKVHTYMMPPPL